MNFDEEILVALYYAALDNKAFGGFRIKDLMPESCSQQDARDVTERLLSQGYIEMPQKMMASPIVYITEKGFKKAQSLL